VVLDPVMVATSGATLIDPAAVDVAGARAVPARALVTPNLDEAALLVEQPLRTEADMEAAARQLLEMGARAVLLKGGHLAGDTVSDLLLARGARRSGCARRASPPATRMAPAAPVQRHRQPSSPWAPTSRRRCARRASSCAARCEAGADVRTGAGSGR
jgi:hydroxymethylpyrimidine/phosphomethylpyrimidine kinase